MYPKSVMLDYSSKEFYVTQDGYDAIKAVIQQHQLCGKCRQPITQEGDHLLVGKNLGLSCLLQQQPQLTFLGPVATNSDGDITYGYTDAENVVYTSQANHSDEARKDVFSSIQRAGFTVPELYVPFKGDKDNPVHLGRSNWTVYGKLHQSVVVLSYKDTYPTIHIVFLSYKGGQVVELNKRNLAFKQLFARASAIVESTKRGSSYYINGYEQARYGDETLYPIIAQLEAAVWDVQRQFAPVPNTYQQQELPVAQEESQGAEAPLPATEEETPKRG